MMVPSDRRPENHERVETEDAVRLCLQLGRLLFDFGPVTMLERDTERI